MNPPKHIRQLLESINTALEEAPRKGIRRWIGRNVPNNTYMDRDPAGGNKSYRSIKDPEYLESFVDSAKKIHPKLEAFLEEIRKEKLGGRIKFSNQTKLRDFPRLTIDVWADAKIWVDEPDRGAKIMDDAFRKVMTTFAQHGNFRISKNAKWKKNGYGSQAVSNTVGVLRWQGGYDNGYFFSISFDGVEDRKPGLDKLSPNPDHDS